MKYTYLVHGAGRQGTAVVYDLIRNCEAKEVRVADPSTSALQAAADRIDRLLPRNDVALHFATTPHYEEVDVVLGCAPYAVNPKLTTEAIEHGIHFCDLGGNPDVVNQQAQMAVGVQTAIVPECGVSPGLSNILATHMALKGAKHVEVRCGGLPVNPGVNELGYKLVFSAEGLLSEYTGPVPVIEKGELKFIEALSIEEPYGDGLVASPTSNNAPEVVGTLLDLGVEHYNYMTLRYRGHWQTIRSLMLLGLTKEELIEKLDSCEALRYDPETDTDRLILEVTGMRFDGITSSWEYSIDVEANPKTKFSAMELLTSWGIAIVAHQIADSDSVQPGFWTPEKHVNHSKAIASLNRRLMEHES